jgi:hypothetical protein
VIEDKSTSMASDRHARREATDYGGFVYLSMAAASSFGSTVRSLAN